jgi:3-oxoacyl-[acyl-carrier-protein] synthase-3
MDGSAIQLVVCATCSGDNIFPATASLIQQAIGAHRAGAFDVNAACTGFMTALATGVQFIEGGMYERVLVVGSDVLSRFLDWTDRSTCILFGDGAGAVVLQKGESGGASSFVIESDGSTADLLYVRGPGGAPATLLESESFCIRMNGPEVFKYAVRAMEDATRKSVAAAGLEVSDIDYLLPHQANLRIMSAVMKGLGLPASRLLCNVGRYGNTSAASIPIALCEAWEEGRLKRGDKLALVAVGGGLVWSASIVEWTGLGSELRA